jgi:hypothetical protein
MGAKLQSLGIDAKVGRHTDWRRVTTAIIANQKKYGRVPGRFLALLTELTVIFGDGSIRRRFG